MGESCDHRPPGWIRQSRKCCAQFIHNHMVVDFLYLSNVNFAIPDLSVLCLGTKIVAIDHRWMLPYAYPPQKPSQNSPVHAPHELMGQKSKDEDPNDANM